MRKILICLILISLTYIFAIDEDTVQFDNAFSHIRGTEICIAMDAIISVAPESYSAQLAYFEEAKINMLQRNYELSEQMLRKIKDEKIIDKEYWLAKCYLKMEDYTRAIISAQNFICDTNDKVKIESAYFLIAESYLLSHQYKRAYNTLESLRTSEYIQNYIPLLFYKMGYCQEKLKKFTNATISYKKLETEYPYHELSFLAEERIIAMQENDQIDFEAVKVQAPQTPIPDTKPGDTLKIYLQTGAFGNSKNAKKLGSKISKVGYNYIIFDKVSNGKKLYCVAAGPFDNNTTAKSALSKLKDNKINSYIIKRY